MFKHFDIFEFACKETGENEISLEFVEQLDNLREVCGFPFSIVSGYRSPKHSIESAKKSPGTHSHGIAADIAVSGGVQRRKIIEEALKMGFGGIGVAETFVHVDMRKTTPVVWAY